MIDSELLKRVPGASPEGCAEILAAEGVELIQYRAKRASAREYFKTCEIMLKRMRSSAAARLIVNDHADIAAMVGAGGVHVGQQDIPLEDARKICGLLSYVGVSTHTIEQIRHAAKTSADYIAVGPIFATSTKEKPETVVGTSLLTEARKLTAKPIVAIGGITRERAPEVYAAGADSIAVSGDLLSARNFAVRAREFFAVAAQFRREGQWHSDSSAPGGSRNG